MKSKRELFEDAEEELRKQKKPITKPLAKKEKTHKKEEHKEPNSLDQAIAEATEELLKKEKKEEKDVSTLLIEETNKKEEREENVNDKKYSIDNTDASSAGDVYARAGSSGGYEALANSNPYNIGNNAYGNAGGAYGSNAYGASGGAYELGGYERIGEVGVYESAGQAASKALDVGGLQQKLNEDQMAGTRITPAAKAHEAHMGGSPVNGCSYCAKAMNR